MVEKECQLDLFIPIHSHLWSKYSKIPGLNLFLHNYRPLISDLLQNIYLSELVDSCKGKLWLNIDPLVSFFVPDQKKKPSFAMFE